MAHACSSALVFCYWQHAEAKNTRLYELKQQLVQTSLRIPLRNPGRGEFLLCENGFRSMLSDGAQHSHQKILKLL
ncbi:hypothetical protein C4K35_5415 [Pseudomonas chlororaphis subsp. piscium]|nr:hypothetical protein C4K35_5415 [Pseudomonas chlororaphis subsp. piscium]AZC59230.1 hypothetical protein C4K34_5088 [Pseudomonas chlororaphis subsp. piscium]AZC77916.1 hypothetical protein C4K31_5036 [Pseudomonas chlororaphis subsp. piscium]AZC91552.1 hypothetical protein C4K29_5274 [Pseudomonas chlororaphis subsp. piscium]AZC97736.1 hypothetical protein C4K28_5031 [Pseudomonas chlororaphis subsp. piscium]